MEATKAVRRTTRLPQLTIDFRRSAASMALYASRATDCDTFWLPVAVEIETGVVARAEVRSIS